MTERMPPARRLDESSFDRDPQFEYGNILPFRKPKAGGPAEWAPGYSGLLRSLKEAFESPGETLRGVREPNVDDALNVALTMLGGSAGAPAGGPGQLNAFIGRRGAQNLGGEYWRRFLEGEKAASGRATKYQLWKDLGYEPSRRGAGRVELPEPKGSFGATGEGPAHSVINWPELFEAYPALRRVPTLIERGQDNVGMARVFNKTIPGRQEALDLFVSAPDRWRASTLAHELQHLVQNQEGEFLQSASQGTVRVPAEVLNRLQETLKAENLRGPATSRYWYTPHEVEARNAGRRADHPELRPFRPELSEDIPRNFQTMDQYGPLINASYWQNFKLK